MTSSARKPLSFSVAYARQPPSQDTTLTFRTAATSVIKRQDDLQFNLGARLEAASGGRMRRLLLSSIILAGACVAPGAPVLRTSADDGQGPLIPDCKNVSSQTRIDDYDTGSYHTTWGSALAEGPGLGTRLSEELTGRSGATRGDDGNQYYALPNQPEPYCRSYVADYAAVAKAVTQILPNLGNPITSEDEEAGVFTTGFINRAHTAAAWRDNYTITLQQSTEGRVIVRVFRDVYISRRRGTYNQGISSGHNEAWVLTQIADRVGG